MTNRAVEVAYMNGEVFTLEGNPEDLFTMLSPKLSDGLYDKKIWYKMPYEDGKDRKMLCNGDSIFMKMCEAARWTGFIDVFVVDTNNFPIDDVQQNELCEEDVRVERNAAAFGDEEESFDHHNTPPNSDGEEEEVVSYVRCKKGSGELKLRQVFDTLSEFKEAVVDYVLKEGWNIKMSKTGKEKNSAICVADGCSWRIYCSYEKPASKWMVKTFQDEHSCTADGYSKIIKEGVIAKMFMDDIRSDPDFRPKTMQTQIQQRYNLIVTYEQCRNAKRTALDLIKAEHDIQFARFKNYKTELLR